jgi:hypothetical protein
MEKEARGPQHQHTHTDDFYEAIVASRHLTCALLRDFSFSFLFKCTGNVQEWVEAGKRGETSLTRILEGPEVVFHLDCNGESTGERKTREQFIPVTFQSLRSQQNLLFKSLRSVSFGSFERVRGKRFQSDADCEISSTVIKKEEQTTFFFVFELEFHKT